MSDQRKRWPDANLAALRTVLARLRTTHEAMDDIYDIALDDPQFVRKLALLAQHDVHEAYTALILCKPEEAVDYPPPVSKRKKR